MLTSAECQARAAQKIAEAELHPRHERRLRTAAEGWLILADVMARVEASLQVAGPAEVGPGQPHRRRPSLGGNTSPPRYNAPWLPHSTNARPRA